MNYKNRWIIAWGTAVLLLLVWLGSIGWTVWCNYRDDIIEKQEEQMLIIVDSLADNLEEAINGNADALTRMTELMNIDEEVLHTEDFMNTIFNNYLDHNQDYAVDLILENPEEEVLWGKKEITFSEIYGRCNLEENGIVLMEAKGQDDNIYFIMERELNNGNKIKLVIDVNQYYQNLISGIRLGTNGYVVVKNSDGIILMHPEKIQLGKNVIEGREQLYKDVDLDSLSELITQQNAEESGVHVYYSYWWSNENLPRVKKIASHAHADFGENYLTVSAVMDYDDIYGPIVEGFRKITLTFISMLFIMIGFLGYVTYLVIQKKKNSQEIKYLKDLNHVLEETKRSEDAIAHQQRLQIIGTMTSGISHEFNNMLTPIMGYADMLLDMSPPDSEVNEFAYEIFYAAEKAKDVIRQISSLSRKNMETVFQYIPAKKMLTRAVKMAHSVCPVNVKIRMFERFKEEGFLGNDTQMKQVLLNLCVNAIHAIGDKKDGQIHIYGNIIKEQEIESKHEITVSETWEHYIEIIVKDNGHGMDAATLEQIFNPFFTTKVGGQGTGLGLSIVEQIVHSHKGYITAESSVHEGSIFYLYLPIVEHVIVQERRLTKDSEISVLKIMVIDDNGKILKLLERGLKRPGISIMAVSNTEEARLALRQETYDVLLIDQNLSKASTNDTGVLFAMSIKQLYPDLIKIIMTDQVRKEIIEAKQRGFVDAYLEKPVSVTGIIEAIRKVRIL